MAWVTVTELKHDMNLDLTDTRDDAVLTETLDAAVTFVERIRMDSVDWIDSAPADVKLGTIRLAARWFTRRRSPAALIEMGDLGAARVPSFDPDIERLLRIGRYAPAVFA